MTKRNDHSLLTYFVDNAADTKTHQLIKNLPAFITNDPTQFCHYYVESSTTHHQTITVQNPSKYTTRSQRLLMLANKTNHALNNTSKSMHETTILSLKKYNPNIKIIKEKTLIKIIEPFVDTRCDEILNQNNKHKNEISYFLMDDNGTFKIDSGYHTPHVERFNYGGDYGPKYQGSLFVDPEQYKLYQSNKLLSKKKKHPTHPNKNKEQKVCVGCRTKYVSDEWETHIKSDVHQKFLQDPAFHNFTQYVNKLNKRLAKPVEKRDDWIFGNTMEENVNQMDMLPEQKCDTDDIFENTNNATNDNNKDMDTDDALENNNTGNGNDTCCIGDNLQPLVIGRRLCGHDDKIHRPTNAYFKCKVCSSIYGPFC
eukprot:522595_1